MRHVQLWALALAALALAAAPARAACPNKCSGHGRCTGNDVCECMQNWQGGDCAERVCPFTRAWHDTPWADDDAHFYAECGNRGACDRDKGVCGCDDGFTGSGCRRIVCPADCSGHGTCEFIEDLAKDTFHVSVGGAQSRVYTLWDREKIMGCVCDPGFEGHDCSLRMCPRGDDPLTPSQVDMKQAIVLTTATAKGYLTYFDPYGNAYTTDTIDLATAATSTGVTLNEAKCALIQTALRRLPNNVLNGVTLDEVANFNPFTRTSPTSDAGTIELTPTGALICVVEFPSGPGTSGYQNKLGCNFGSHGEKGMRPLTAAGTDTCTVYEYYGSGATTAVAGTRALTELAVCSGRGQCDQTTGLCKCYSGHMGLACQKQEALV